MPPGVEAASFGAGGAFSGEKTLEGVEQVAAGEDADERTIVDDLETTAFGQLHASESGKQSVGRRDGFRITGHHAFDGGVRKNGVVGILGDGNQARRSAALNVAVREKADEFWPSRTGRWRMEFPRSKTVASTKAAEAAIVTTGALMTSRIRYSSCATGGLGGTEGFSTLIFSCSILGRKITTPGACPKDKLASGDKPGAVPGAERLSRSEFLTKW